MPTRTYGCRMDQDQQARQASTEEDAVKALSNPEAQQANPPKTYPKITMYTTTWCSDCVAAKRYLDAKGVSYTEVDIEQDERAAELVMQINDGRRSVPTLVTERTAASLSGFSIAKARAFLESAGLTDSQTTPQGS